MSNSDLGPDRGPDRDADRDDARDAWLSQALRHAPDADATPPPALRESILAKARAAAAPSQRAAARPRTLADVLHGWWMALARPPVAAGFASVMAATLVGLMWWDRPMDETMPRPPAPSARSAPTPAPTPSLPAPAQAPEASALGDPPSTAQAPTTEAPAAPPPATLGRAPTPNPPRTARSRDASEDARESAREAAPAARKAEAPAPFPATRATPDVARAPLEEAKKDRAPSAFAGPSANVAPAESAPAMPAAPVTPSPAPRAAPAPSTSPAPPESGRAAGALRSEMAADRADKSLARSAAPALPSAPTGAAPSRQRSDTDARAAADAIERERPAAASSPLGSVLDAIARQPQRWTRLAADGSTSAIDAAWRAWLAELDATVAGSWQRAGSGAGAGAPAGDDAARDATVLQLFLDGQPAATLRVDGRSARLDRLADGPAGHWRATLGAEAANRLGAARARLSP